MAGFGGCAPGAADGVGGEALGTTLLVGAAEAIGGEAAIDGRPPGPGATGRTLAPREAPIPPSPSFRSIRHFPLSTVPSRSTSRAIAAGVYGLLGGGANRRETWASSRLVARAILAPVGVVMKGPRIPRSSTHHCESPIGTT